VKGNIYNIYIIVGFLTLWISLLHRASRILYRLSINGSYDSHVLLHRNTCKILLQNYDHLKVQVKKFYSQLVNFSVSTMSDSVR